MEVKENGIVHIIDFCDDQGRLLFKKCYFFDSIKRLLNKEKEAFDKHCSQLIITNCEDYQKLHVIPCFLFDINRITGADCWRILFSSSKERCEEIPFKQFAVDLPSVLLKTTNISPFIKHCFKNPNDKTMKQIAFAMEVDSKRIFVIWSMFNSSITFHNDDTHLIEGDQRLKDEHISFRIKAFEHYGIHLRTFENHDHIFDDGFTYEQRGFDKLAIAIYEELAKKNDPDALCRLGQLYKQGKIVEQDYKIAYEYFFKSESPLATFELSTMYEDGLYVPKDLDKSLSYLIQASEKGCDIASNNLGYKYLKGLGVPVDYEKAFKYLSKAADKNASAAFQLGIAYKYGVYGVNKDTYLARKFLEKAVSLGNEEAKMHLSIEDNSEKYFVYQNAYLEDMQRIEKQ